MPLPNIRHFLHLPRPISVLCQTAICSHGPSISRWHTPYIPQHLHPVPYMLPPQTFTSSHDWRTSKEIASDTGRCPVQILARTMTVPTDMPTSNPGTDTDCPDWYAHFKSWDRHWLSQLICPLQILGRTLTVPTDMPTSNPGKDTDCPNWYAHFKSWEGHWLSLQRCPLQIWQGHWLSLLRHQLQIWQGHWLSGKDTDCPYWGINFKSGKDTDCPYWDAQFKFWEAQWLYQLTCPVQILGMALTVLTAVYAPLLHHPVAACPYLKETKHCRNDCGANWT
jgi:hypothetical protein